MSEEVLKQLATAIVEQSYHDWHLGVLIAISIVAGAVGAYAGSYLAKRGETLATKTDFDEIVKQLRATTKVAEEVRLALGRADWVEREWTTLRRAKLEELVDAVDGVEREQTTQTARLLLDEPTLHIAELSKAALLQMLYFPELKDEVRAFDDAVRTARADIACIRAEARSIASVTTDLDGDAQRLSGRATDTLVPIARAKWALFNRLPTFSAELAQSTASS